MRRSPRILVAAALAVGAATGVLPGCGGGGESTTPTIQTATTPSTTSPATGTQTAPAPGPATNPAPAPTAGGGKVAVPNLVGSRLDDAQASLVKLGLSGRAESLNGGNRTQIKPDWEVCQVVPPAGKKVPPGSPLTLITAAPGGC